MPVLLNNVNPALRIYDPESEEFVAFRGGKLEIEEGDLGYEAVMAEAERNPSIIVVVNGKQCTLCGETFTGKAAAAQLGNHTKNVHFEVWQAGREEDNAQAIAVEVKKRSPFACDVCPTTQEFGSAEDLALHAQLIHTAPDVDGDGNAVGEGPGNGASRQGRSRGGNAAAQPPADPTA